ncbi:MAG: hypothetical protein KAQ97_00065, partial [Candidatus Fermentibacteraceae bacterium]|nr:hypothetical protein [Candidatus Fermentibacteraceae bacterium]
PGEVTIEDDMLFVGCCKGSLKILTLQPASKRVMVTADFLRGVSLKTGDILGSKK